MLHQIDKISGIGLHLDMVLRKVQEAYLQKFKELQIDMTIEQWVILYRIYQLGDDASQSEIVKSNFRNRATTSRVIGGMERKGWITKTRFKGDLKRFKLELTKKGQALISKVEPHANLLRKKAVSGLDASEFDTFLKVLNKIATNYEAL